MSGPLDMATDGILSKKQLDDIEAIMAPPFDLTFTQGDAEAAHRAWGCNCGPTALAACLDCTLDAARLYIPGFEAKRYTSPTMMLQALTASGREFRKVSVAREPKNGLVRVQWHGPWTEPGTNPKWAYGYTHWFARRGPWVFDCNGGVRTIESWKAEIAPLLTDFPRCNGKWSVTHILEVINV